MRGRDLDGRRAIEETAGEAPDLVRERRREQQVLAARREEVEDLADIADEAHVEHPIGLVEDEHLDLRQVDRALAGVVEQAAGGGDDDRRAGAEGTDLRLETDATVDRGRSDAAMCAVRPEALLDLEGELTSWCQDEDADRRPGRVARVPGWGSGADSVAVVEALEDRQDERGRLAGAGLGAGEQVAAGQHEGDCLCLNGGGLGVALVRDSAEELGREPEGIEGHGSISS